LVAVHQPQWQSRPPGGESSLLLAEQQTAVRRVRAGLARQARGMRGSRPTEQGYRASLSRRLLVELPFKLAWAAGADRPCGGTLPSGEAALISFDAEAAPVLDAKTREVRRGCLTHDCSRTMPRRRSAADHAERAMLFLTAQNLRRSGPELAAVQWTPMDHPGKSARSWATSLGSGSVTWSIPPFVTGCPPCRTLRERGSVVWLTGPRPLRACNVTCS
jgi:hypothetical protein